MRLVCKKKARQESSTPICQILKGFVKPLRFPGSSAGKESLCNAGEPGLVPGSESSPGEGVGYPLQLFLGFPGGSDGKESALNVGDLGLIPGLGRSPGGGRGNPPQYSCLENPHGQRSLAGYSPQDHTKPGPAE